MSHLKPQISVAKTVIKKWFSLRVLAPSLVVLVVVSIGAYHLTHSAAVTSGTDAAVTINLTIYSPPVSITFTTSGHSLGDCTSQPGQTFVVTNNTRTCNGASFGTPDGMSLYAASVPTGYRITGYRVINQTNGAADCSTSGCSFNFYSGTAYIQVDIERTAPANSCTYDTYNSWTPPVLSVASRTTSSVTFQWTKGDMCSHPIDGYDLVLDKSVLLGPSARSYTWTGLACGVNYGNSFFVRVFSNPESTYDTASNFVTASTAPCPSAATSSSPPTAASSSTATSSASRTATSSRKTTQLQVAPLSSNNSTDQAVAAPPVSPTNFVATPAKGSAVELTWDADSTVTKYVLERSLNGTDWSSVDAAVVGHSYYDTDTTFATTFYYRLTAVDANDLQSTPVTTQVTTNTFTGNVGGTTDLRLTSADGVLTLFIPAKAVPEPVNCQLTQEFPLPLFALKDYQQASGSYAILCQKANGDQLTAFKQPLSSSIDVTRLHNADKYSTYVLAGYNGGAQRWSSSTLPTSHKLQLQPTSMGVSVYGKLKHTPWYVTLIKVLVIVLALMAGTYFGLRKLMAIQQRRRLQAIHDDYWHKQNGV